MNVPLALAVLLALLVPGALGGWVAGPLGFATGVGTAAGVLLLAGWP